MNLINLTRDALVRVVAIREALEDGDPSHAYALATDLEHDLAGGLAEIGDDEPRVCLSDFNDVPSYGARDPRTIAWCRAYLSDAEGRAA